MKVNQPGALRRTMTSGRRWPGPSRYVSLVAVLLASTAAAEAQSACTAIVVNVAPITRYDRDAGVGFLPLRSGPSSRASAVGEVYRGDILAISGSNANWLSAACIQGRCSTPLWGPGYPRGWVHRSYVRLSGDCPR